MDRARFYGSIRPHVNLTTQNVLGFEKLFAYAEKHWGRLVLQMLAYIIATAWWESAQTMHPVKEAYWLSEDWRRKNLRYYPWYGRGLVQTTWEANYRKIAVAIGLPADFFTKDPNMLLLFEYALPALFVGMQQGIYTGKDTDDYIDMLDESDEVDFVEYKNARRVVNAMDKATTIANLALMFEKALKAAGWGGKTPIIEIEVPKQSLPIEPGTVVVVKDGSKRGWWDRFFGWLTGAG